MPAFNVKSRQRESLSVEDAKLLHEVLDRAIKDGLYHDDWTKFLLAKLKRLSK